jgi:hypothetical protein
MSSREFQEAPGRLEARHHHRVHRRHVRHHRHVRRLALRHLLEGHPRLEEQPRVEERRQWVPALRHRVPRRVPHLRLLHERHRLRARPLRAWPSRSMRPAADRGQHLWTN